MTRIDYDLENDLAVRKLKEAAALRGSELASPTIRVGDRDIVNWLGPVNRLMEQTQGNRMEDESTARLRGLGQQQQGEVDTYNKAVSTPGTRTLSQEGPTVDGGNIPDQQIPLSPEAENQRQMALSMDAMRLPKARAMASQFVQSGVGFPEKQAQLKAQQDLQREQQAARLQQAKEQAAMLEEGRAQRAADSNALKMTIAQIAASNRGVSNSNADLQRELLQARIDKLHEGPKPTAAETKAKAAEEKAIKSAERIDGLVKEAGDNKGAFGIVPAVASMLPNVIGSRITSKSLTEKEQVTRAKVMTEGAKVIHDIYGAALSRGEAARADSWAPNPNDDYNSIVRKMKAAKEYSKSLTNTSGAPAAPAAGGIRILSVE